MRHSQRATEGYLLIDQSQAPGVPDALAHAIGSPVVAAGERYESATITCAHCQAIVVLNPNRSRSRGYCAKCDHYICDVCTALGVCRPFAQLVETLWP